jgi:hypothetical protein
MRYLPNILLEVLSMFLSSKLPWKNKRFVLIYAIVLARSIEVYYYTYYY